MHAGKEALQLGHVSDRHLAAAVNEQKQVEAARRARSNDSIQ